MIQTEAGKWEHRGEVIEVLADGRFMVTHDDGTGKGFEALVGAEQYIDSQSSLKRTPLALATLTGDGTPVTVKTVNRSSGQLVDTNGKKHRELFVDSPRIRAAIAEQGELSRRLDVVYKSIVHCRIHSQSLYREGVPIEVNDLIQRNYDRAVGIDQAGGQE